MATKVYMLHNAFEGPGDFGLDAPVGTVDTAGVSYPLRFTAGIAATSSSTTPTAAGPTAGVPVKTGAFALEWFSEPLEAVTISGTVTLNVWMEESSMSANVGAQVRVCRCDYKGAEISEILNSERGVELGTGSAVQNWTAAPTSTTLDDFDRLKVEVFGNDVGTMASGFNFRLTFSGPTGGADGDSWVQFTETITERPFVAEECDINSDS